MTHAEWSALGLSVAVGLCVCVVVAGPGVLLGWVLARWRFPGRFLLDALVHVPLVLTPVVVGYGLLLLVGRQGLLGGWLDALGLRLAFTFPGAVVAAAVVALPLVVRSVRTSIELVDPALEEAAAVLGAGPWRRFWTVTLPLASPGVVGGLVLGFARSLGEFGATITFAGNIAGETRTLPVALYTATQTPGGDALALRMAGLSVALSVVALVASEWFVARLRQQSAGGDRP